MSREKFDDLGADDVKHLKQLKFVVVQSGTNAAASIYYVDTTVVPGTDSVNELVQNGSATLIGQVSNVTGLFTAADFVIA